MPSACVHDVRQKQADIPTVDAALYAIFNEDVIELSDYLEHDLRPVVGITEATWKAYKHATDMIQGLRHSAPRSTMQQPAIELLRDIFALREKKERWEAEFGPVSVRHFSKVRTCH